MARHPLTIDEYCLKINRVISLLKDPTALQAYPNLTRLLDRKRRATEKHESTTNRALLVILLEHIRSTVMAKPSEAIYDNSGRITAYAVTISIRYLSRLWKMSPIPADKTAYLFSATTLINRSQSHSQQALAFSEKAQYAAEKDYRETAQSLGIDPEPSRSHHMFRYWVDGWTSGQLKEKERKAAEQIAYGKTTGMQRTDVITIHGQATATAISENGSRKSKKQLHREDMVIKAYEHVVSRKDYPIVSKAEILEDLKKKVPRKLKDDPPEKEVAEQRWLLFQEKPIVFRARYPQWQHTADPTYHDLLKEVRQQRREAYHKRLISWPESWWKNGKVALMAQYDLSYRQLTKEEKRLYGIDAGRGTRYLIPANTETKAESINAKAIDCMENQKA